MSLGSFETSRPGAQVGNHLRHGQAHDGIGHIRQRGNQEQFADVLRVRAAEIGVHDLGNGLPARGNVVTDGILQGRIDERDFGQRFAVVQIQVMGVNQRAARPCRLGSKSRDTITRIRRMRPRVCWKPGFSRKRA